MKVVAGKGNQFSAYVGCRFVCTRSKEQPTLELEREDLAQIKIVNFPSYQSRHYALACPQCGAHILLEVGIGVKRNPYLLHM